MIDMFLSILNISITASWLILVLIIVRPLMKKAPKWINCALWALVAIRLVCPFSFESSVRLIPNSEPVSHDIAMDRTPSIDSGVKVLNDAINPVIADTFTPSPVASANPLQIVIPILAIVWLVGIAVLIIYALVSFFRLKKSVGASLPLEENVLACDEVKSPFILGVIRPIIYVPSAMTGDSLNYVIRHEKTHIKRGDHFWKPFGYALLAVYWFNPLCWLAYILLCRDIELACDEKVIRDMDNEGKAAYSQALLNCSFPRRRIAACPLAFGEVGVKERVKSVLNYKKPAFWIICLSIVACIILMACFLTNPKGKGEYQLLGNASPETSAMELKYFDGTNTETKWIYDEKQERKIIDEINGLSARKCDNSRVSEMTIPCYGLEITDQEGYMIWLTYSNGLWLQKDGSVYEADYDFEKLYSKTGSDDLEVMTGGSGMTNAGLLGEYDTSYYVKAPDMNKEKDGVSISVTGVEGIKVTLLIDNKSGADFIFGKNYYLQKEIDGVWYRLPVKKSNYSFTDIACVLSTGECHEEECDLTMYGELSDGHYRIEKEGMVAEFNIKNQVAYIPEEEASDIGPVEVSFGTEFHSTWEEWKFECDPLPVEYLRDEWSEEEPFWQFAAPKGTEVYGCFNGTAVSGYYSDAGYCVEIICDDEPNLCMVYSHLEAQYLQDSCHVEAGDKVGCVGASGAATGPFLAVYICNNHTEHAGTHHMQHGAHEEKEAEHTSSGTTNSTSSKHHDDKNSGHH